jgi:hypothetical protein
MLRKPEARGAGALGLAADLEHLGSGGEAIEEYAHGHLPIQSPYAPHIIPETPLRDCAGCWEL